MVRQAHQETEITLNKVALGLKCVAHRGLGGVGKYWPLQSGKQEGEGSWNDQLTLGRVIDALVDKTQHVPYR